MHCGGFSWFAEDQAASFPFTTERMTNKTLEYSKTAMDFVDTYSIFIAGAEWVLKNKGNEIDFEKSLQVLREKYKKRSEEQDYEERHALESY